MINWMLKKENSISGLVCTVLSVYGIKYPQMVKIIGEPHSFEEKDNKDNPIKAKWLFVMFNGTKVEIRFDRDEATLRKMQRENLMHGERDSMENCDYMTIMGDTNSTIIILTLLKYLFPKSKGEGRREIGDKHYVIRKIYE